MTYLVSSETLNLNCINQSGITGPKLRDIGDIRFRNPDSDT